LRRTIHKSRLAESDLVEIWEYSYEQWDAKQADKYLDELDRRIQLLADDPELGGQP
jgi:toxin ParE1/3/4